ncbi:unnamed protein product [Camellia sinensis]|uniref:Uncharacterized protein n=1 Tax=Camellia sinensis TaxID=4442 RepID=A0A7J7GP08_CAMSI|nr:hypothetical protein HYC85_019293 [Camellia sinensis]
MFQFLFLSQPKSQFYTTNRSKSSRLLRMNSLSHMIVGLLHRRSALEPPPHKSTAAAEQQHSSKQKSDSCSNMKPTTTSIKNREGLMGAKKKIQNKIEERTCRHLGYF